ncbi:MAG: thioredoxin domain-containing protein [Chitinophagales bacterium]
MNRLANETSPYLLQHAHNPVDWFPWGDEAFEKARSENKPLLVSIGYSACHWCHVMERESFEDPATAEIMNRDFVNVKIDREERPDLDHIYMDAVQAIAGNGGWPLNVFLTPEGKPFYGGTYFPPVNAFNRPSWTAILKNVSSVFRDQRKEIEAQAENLTNHIAHASITSLPDPKSLSRPPITKEQGETVFENLMKTADRISGGFGEAPKFPQTFSIRFLLQHYYYTRNELALGQACLSLDKMIYGGIYDQLAGGFARYSTDREWLAPHFEKMLYDNALLITALSEAYQITKKPVYRKTILQTMDFITREFLAPGGGFYSALDADSEGVEGKYYVWDKAETDALLEEHTPAFSAYYDITEKGNWEGKNILRIKDPSNPLPEKIDRACRELLLKTRQNRVSPQLDDKILLGWNALMITACCKAFAALGIPEYRQLAKDGMAFVEDKFGGEGIFHFYHSYKEGRAGIPAFLDDYAYLIEAYIQLQEITGSADYLEKAAGLTHWVVRYFSEEETGYFLYTHEKQDDVIVRKKEVFDGAIPSGNAVMASNLLYLGIALDSRDWKQRSSRMTDGLTSVIFKYPGSFGTWATLLNAFAYGMYELVLSGENQEEKQLGFLARFVPNRVFQLTSSGQPDFPLLRNKPVTGLSQFFLCRDYACQQPVTELNELLRLMETT